MFTTAVDKLLSQFFALSAEERSCILEVLVHSQPINNSDGVESFLSKEARCQPVRSARLSALQLIKSCKKRQTLWDSTLYMSRLQQKLWLEQRVLFQPLQERNFSMVQIRRVLHGPASSQRVRTKVRNFLGYLFQVAPSAARRLTKDTQLGKTDRRRRS